MSDDHGSTGNLLNKVALVTGAAGGIGACIAQAFAKEGAAVILADIRATEANAAAMKLREQGSNTTSREIDISNPDSVERAVNSAIASNGRIDILVNCAAIDAPRGLAWEESEQHWRQIIDVNLNGSWWCTRAVIPHMIEQRSGRIIFISSTAARRGVPGLSVAYNASKSALLGLTVGLAKQLEQYGVLVNAITPGATGNTGEPMTPEEREKDLMTYPLGFGGPEPVAHACLYLAGRSGEWISGTVLNVSGGRWHG
ncbi:SDR family NAD(P)-dependent oxidoreductase [Mesorhizobium sp.]|uniref:SDR family NAD(P)-dependent oxidoreductase n=1 Tax=Mesorhizobium sp. TaxID=1871066 RepID=UPI0025D6A748|nr:SDR family NAD(P)-dependent oxidoreductase [Mesorhizobium sp.]